MSDAIGPSAAAPAVRPDRAAQLIRLKALRDRALLHDRALGRDRESGQDRRASAEDAETFDEQPEEGQEARSTIGSEQF